MMYGENYRTGDGASSTSLTVVFSPVGPMMPDWLALMANGGSFTIISR
jgi:hypothetical protein